MLRLDLRTPRERVGISQQELAEIVGTRQATISALERGDSRRIDFGLLERIGVELGVHPADLFVWEPDPVSAPEPRTPPKRRGRG